MCSWAGSVGHEGVTTKSASASPLRSLCVPLCVLPLVLAAPAAGDAGRQPSGPRAAARPSARESAQRAADAALAADLRRARVDLQRERDEPRLVGPVAALALGA